MGSLNNKIACVISETKKKDNKSIFNILMDLFNYCSRQGLSPGEYFTYGLQSKIASTSYCLDYMPNSVHFKEHLATLNNLSLDILEDKLLFKNLMQKENIPTPVTIGYAGPKKRSNLDFELITPHTIHKILSAHNATDFIVKPSNGTHGKGIYHVKYCQGEANPFYINKKPLGTSDLFEFLTKNCESLNKGNILFEHIASRNETLKNISPDASPNIRIITLKLPNGDIHITSASMRLGRANSVTSNASSGGMLAKIDIKSGSIVKCRTTSYMGGKFISIHPDTLCPIIGVEIPNWNDVLSICKKSATVIESMNSVGWDVLIDNTTPIIIEGNGQWCMVSEQLFGQGYLTPKNRELLKVYGLEFPNGIMPKPSLAKLKLALFGSGANNV